MRGTLSRPTDFSGLLSQTGLALLFFVCVAPGATVETIEGKVFDGDAHFNKSGALVVQQAKADSITIELTNITHATFAPGHFFSSGSLLPNGWSVQDMGDTHGFTRLDGDVFTLRVEGQSTNATACHFVSRPMHSDGGIVARIEEVGGSSEARAGIMMRVSGSSVFIALSCDRDGKVWFERRPDAERKEIRSSVLATMAPPIWLRLQKREKSIAAMFSKDGRSWQTFTDSVKFQAEKAWREGEGELQLLRASFGIFASGRGKESICTARVAQVAMTLHGLLGEYFSGQRFEQLKFARLDPQLRFGWGLHSPDASLDKEDFSVRWTGKLVPPKTGAYRFHFDADDSARLWVDREEMPQLSFRKPDKPAAAPALTLTAGRAVEFRMEFVNGKGPASVRIGWAIGGHSPEVIGMTNFVFLFRATNSPERTLAFSVTNESPVRGVLLRDGSFIAGTVASGDDTAVQVSFGGRKDVFVLSSRVARIALRPPRQALRYEDSAGRTGLFLRNGDFFESKFHAIEWGTVSMSSVLFGLKRFGIEGGEPVVLVLNDCALTNTPYEVRLLDGSVLRAAKISANERVITIEEPLLGQLSIPAGEIFKISRVDNAVQSSTAKRSQTSNE
jgi:hypothetical protein